MEEWRPIKDYEGLYEISNLGRVKSLNYKRTGKKKILKNMECGNGYLTVSLTKNGKQKVFYIHRLVAVAFIPNPESKPCIDHINTIRTENCVWNLRWVTYEENNNNHLTNKKQSESKKGDKCYNYGKKGKYCHSSKKVVQLSCDGVLIKIWDCIIGIEREEGFNRSAITDCCKGRRKDYKGFKWMYYEDYIN